MATLIKIRGLDTSRSTSGSVLPGRGFRVPVASGNGVKASYTTSLAGANNDLVWTAVTGGPYGNDITIRYVDPGANSQALSVSTSGKAITVNLATDGGGAITSTATLVKTAVNADATAGAFVQGANAASNSGAGVVTAMSVQSLAGGVYDDSLTSEEPIYALVNSGATVIVDIEDEATAKILKKNGYRFVVLGTVA